MRVKKKKIFTIQQLPAPLRRWLVRYKTKVDLTLLTNNNIVLKVAETEDELMQAFSLVQSMYEKAKIVNQGKISLRITKYHLLPTTKVLIAKEENKVIGTLSVIMDTPLGLPIDDFISLGDLRKRNPRICEISSLAIDPDWRSASKGLFIPLSLYSIWYSKYVIGADELVIITNNSARHVYEDLFLFEPLIFQAQKYESVNHSKAFAQHLNLIELENKYLENYLNSKPERNIYTMLTNPPWKENMYREKHPFKIVPLMKYTQSTLDKIFETYSMLDKLEDRDKQVIYNHYSIFKKGFGENIFINKRRHPRFYTKMNADIEIGGHSYDSKCLQISKGGANFKLPKGLPISDMEYKVTVYFDSHESCSFFGKIAWNSKFQIGFEANESTTQAWENYLNFIEKDFSSDKIFKQISVS